MPVILEKKTTTQKAVIMMR